MYLAEGDGIYCLWLGHWLRYTSIIRCSHVKSYLCGSDTTHRYHVRNRLITTTASYKDLGITVTSSLSWTDHLSRICTKAYSALHTIQQILPSKLSIGLWKSLYLSSVRFHLTHGSQIWCRYLLQDVKNLEQVQRRATKIILQVSGLNYKERLLQLELLPLSRWLELRDILFLVRNLKNPSGNFTILDYVNIQKSNTRLSTKKKHLVHNYTRTTMARHFYYKRIVWLWYSLLEINLENSVTTIKVMLIRFFATIFA